MEDWKYTDVSPIAAEAFGIADADDTDVTFEYVENLLGYLPAARLVFVNGIYAPALSSIDMLPNGVKALSLAQALKIEWSTLEQNLGRIARWEGKAFTALNTALSQDGAFIHIGRGHVVEEPIHLVFVGTDQANTVASHPRVLLIAEENAQATVVETYVGAPGARYFTNAVIEVIAQENAVIDHYRIQRESDQAFHVSTTQVELNRSANFTTTSISLGGRLVRNDVNVLLNAQGIECTLNGLYLANGSQFIDNHTAIDHAKPHCSSHELYKGIMDGHSTGVFNGKVFVRQDAQKTDARQTNQNLLLSEDANIDTKPQLEIFADDVRCTHGATVGQLDAEALFYLRARGIGLEEARKMLVFAFASDVVDKVKVANVRDSLQQTLFAQFDINAR